MERYCTTSSYCTDAPHGGGANVLNVTAGMMRAALEPVLLQYKVDAVFAGHVHSYERTHQVGNNIVTSTGEKVTDPDGTTATVYKAATSNGGAGGSAAGVLHFTVGTGGADPDAITSWGKKTEATAYRFCEGDSTCEDSNWGYSRVTANQTTLSVDFVEAVGQGRSAYHDRVRITKD